MLAEDLVRTAQARAALFDEAPAAGSATAQQIIAHVVEQHHSTDVAALTSLVLDRIPKDQGTLWRLLLWWGRGEDGSGEGWPHGAVAFLVGPLGGPGHGGLVAP